MWECFIDLGASLDSYDFDPQLFFLSFSVFVIVVLCLIRCELALLQDTMVVQDNRVEL
jgi:hypothetical protein